MPNKSPLDKEDFLEDDSELEPDEDEVTEELEDPSLDQDDPENPEDEEDSIEQDLRKSQERPANIMELAARSGTNKKAPPRRSEAIVPKVDPRDSLLQQYVRENSELKGKIKTLEGMLSKARSGQSNQSQPVSTSSQADDQQATGRIIQLEAQVKDLEEIIKKNDEEIVQLTNLRNKANRRCQDCRELEQLNDLLKKERKEHSDERSQWIGENKQLERDLERDKNDKEKLAKELSGIKGELARLRVGPVVQDSKSVELTAAPQDPKINLSREQKDGRVISTFSFTFDQANF